MVSSNRAARRHGQRPNIVPNSGAQAVVQNMVQHAAVLRTKTITVFDEQPDGALTLRRDPDTDEPVTFDIQYAPLSFFDRLRLRSEARVGFIDPETGNQTMIFREDVYYKAAISAMVRVTPIEFSDLVLNSTSDWLGEQLAEIVPQPEGDFARVEEAKKGSAISDLDARRM